MDEYRDHIALRDENGEDIKFDYLDTIDISDKKFIVLMPVEQSPEEEGEVVILEVKNDGKEEKFHPVESESELNKVFEIFMERIKDEFALQIEGL